MQNTAHIYTLTSCPNRESTVSTCHVWRQRQKEVNSCRWLFSLDKTTYDNFFFFFKGAGSKATSFHFMDQVTSRCSKYATCAWFYITRKKKKKNITLFSTCWNVSSALHFYIHVGHKRRALSLVVDVVIIRHGTRREGGVHCSLCTAMPNDWIRCVHCSFSLCEATCSSLSTGAVTVL